jgi:hypothetical protein
MPTNICDWKRLYVSTGSVGAQCGQQPLRSHRLINQVGDNKDNEQDLKAISFFQKIDPDFICFLVKM